MSDGSISQDEIDALLSGMDMGGAAAPEVVPEKTDVSDFKGKAFKTFLVNPCKAFEENLTSMTGSETKVTGTSYSSMNREAFMQIVPELVVASTCDFASGLSGDHLFILPHEMAAKIVGLVNHEEKADIDDMALSVVSEVISQCLSAEITEFDAIGLKGVSHNPPESMNIPKAMIRLPQKSFAIITYEITVDGSSFTFWEVVNDDAATKIAETINGTSAPESPAKQPKTNSTETKNSIEQQQQAQPQMQANFSGGINMSDFGQINTGMQSQNIQSAGSNPTVQPIAYPQLQSFDSGENKNNIGLIMDVLMELTVELGRTKKTVREILGMGEGHIISLDKLAGESVDILVNHKPIAKGEVVVIEENFGVRVTEILSPNDRANSLTK